MEHSFYESKESQQQQQFLYVVMETRHDGLSRSSFLKVAFNWDYCGIEIQVVDGILRLLGPFLFRHEQNSIPLILPLIPR